MHIGIYDSQADSKLVYESHVNMAGLNYAVQQQEFFDQAWKAAVESGAVEADQRPRYVFGEIKQL